MEYMVDMISTEDMFLEKGPLIVSSQEMADVLEGMQYIYGSQKRIYVDPSMALYQCPVEGMSQWVACYESRPTNMRIAIGVL